MPIYLLLRPHARSHRADGARDPSHGWCGTGSLGVSFVGSGSGIQPVFGARSGNRILSLPYMIAVGMGLQSREGLAIGASYAGGEYTLSALLAGSACTTEPRDSASSGHWKNADVLARCGVARPDCRLPTCVGTFLSGQGVSSHFSICFYALAAGRCSMVLSSR